MLHVFSLFWKRKFTKLGYLWIILKNDLVLYSKQGELVAVYPYSSEEQWRYERFLDILFEADKKRFDELLEKRRS